MKVFISWSGKLSGDVASLLNEWLPSAVPGTAPWLSKEGIDKGSIWFGDIEKELKDTSVGIICLTRENMNRPWILFEAGGLSKGLDKSRVCPLLIDLDDKELDPPLKAFHATKPSKEDMLALCKTINRQNKGNVFPDPQLEKFFRRFWRDFESKFTVLLKKHGKSKPPKKKEVPETVEQILEIVTVLLRASQSGPALLPIFPPSRYAALGYLDYPGNLPSGVYPPFVPEPFAAQLPKGLAPAPPATGLQVKLDELLGKVVKPAMAKGQKPESSKTETPPNKPPAD